jgi:hypothetical protein
MKSNLKKMIEKEYKDILYKELFNKKEFLKETKITIYSAITGLTTGYIYQSIIDYLK